MLSVVELRAVSAVGLVYTTRMLGLFMILPVLALNADQYSGATTTSIGLALGIYGLMQALLQVPFGRLSDRIGRKPVILAGLALFAGGSVLAAQSESIELLILARAIQGSGAVSAALLALLSECSREQNRSKLMALLGMSIGLSFGLAMVLGPIFTAAWGMQSIFWLCVVLAAIGALSILTLSPHADKDMSEHNILGSATRRTNWLELRRLNLGIFVLHAAQMSLWIAVPVMMLESYGISEDQHWKWYLLAVGGGFVLMLPLMQSYAKKNWYRSTLFAGIASLSIAHLIMSQSLSFGLFIAGLLIFFWGFNLLEATLPSLVSRRSADENRGRAMGWYATSQFLGTFVGATLGGWLVSQHGLEAVFYLGIGLFILWFFVVVPMQPLPRIKSFITSGLSERQIKTLGQTLGVNSVISFAGQKEIFVKVDLDLIESETLEDYDLT